MNKILKTISNFLDMRTLPDLSEDDRNFEKRSIFCFEQVFFYLYNRINQALKNSHSTPYPEEYVKLLTCLLIIKSIYNGKTNYFYNPYSFELNYLPYSETSNKFDTTYLIESSTKLELAYNYFVKNTKSINSIEFNSLSDEKFISKNDNSRIYLNSVSVPVHGFGNTVFSSHDKYVKWEFTNNDRISHAQIGDTEPGKITYDESILIPKDFRQYFDYNEIKFNNDTYKSSIFTYATVHKYKILPFDKNFLLYSTLFYSKRNIYEHELDRDFLISDHFYLFLFCNGVITFNHPFFKFKPLIINDIFIEKYVEEAIVRAIQFFTRSTLFTSCTFSDNLLSNPNKIFNNYSQNPSKEFIDDLQLSKKGKHNDVFTNSDENAVDSNLSSSTRNDRRKYENFSYWHYFETNDEFEILLKEAAMDLLNKENKELSDVAILTLLWKKKGFPDFSPISYGKVDKYRQEKPPSRWAQSIKRAIDILACSKKFPPILKKKC